MDEARDESAGGAGATALLGFDYQVEVSVWLALDVMAATRLTEEMTLEHVSEEDIEADVEEFEPGPVSDPLPMRSYRLIVQAKRRTGDAWTRAGIVGLLNHGKRRDSALTRLEQDPRARYLLVTSAALNNPVRAIGVGNVGGSWPTARRVEQALGSAGEDLAGRIAIIGSKDEERLESHIKTLLLERFRVPRARWEECLSELRKAAGDRMRGLAGGRWTRDEIEGVIAEHEGYLVGQLENDGYVQPTNWGDLTAALANHHALMIIGQSGSGKTAAAEALWRHQKALLPDLKRVRITGGPEELEAHATLPPVLYDIEDPWGRIKFEPDRRPWNDRLATAFATARHDRLFVATSRTDVATASGAAESVQRWQMPLDVENYGRAERRRLYRNLSAGLPPELAAFAHENESRVLRQLGLPLELRKFFDALPGLDREELVRNPPVTLSVAIAQAHKDSIERTVVEQIEASDAVKAAAVIWALIKAHGRLSAEVLRSLEDPLVDADSSLEDRIGQLVNGFVAGRNLRQGADGSLAYYHGKVEAGIEQALARHPQAVRRTLTTLVDALLARDEETGGTWGVETAAEIVRLSQRVPGATPTPSRASQDRLDAWVERSLEAEGHDLQSAVSLAAAVGSLRSNPAELARWLKHRQDRSFASLMHWTKPQRDESWHTRMRADPGVRSLAERFVQTVLPRDNTSFPDTFAADLAELAGDLTDAFLEAAKGSASYGYISNDDAIAAGALADVDRFEAVVDAAVAALQPSESELARFAENRLMVINDEVGDEYAQHLAENDDGMTAETYLAAYVDSRRAERQWQLLAEHRHRDELLEPWLRALSRSKEPLDMGELDAAANASHDTDEEHWLWSILAKQWDDRFSARLVERIVKGHPDSRVRQDALDCFSGRLQERMPDVVSRLTETGANTRLAQLAFDLAHAAAKPDRDAHDREKSARDLIEDLPEPFRAFAHAELAVLEDKVPSLSAEGAAVIAAIDAPPEDLRAARVRVARHVALEVGDDVRWLLANTDNHDHALAAIDAAIACGMAPEIEAALDHKFAHVAARALTVIADPLPAPLPAAILARAQRTSSPVRTALLAQIKAKPHANHLTTLLMLTDDEWSHWVRRDSDDGEFPIAREAAAAIAALDAVPDDILGALIDRAKVAEDIALIGQLLACVVRHGTASRQAEVVAMSRKGRRVVVGRAASWALFDQCQYLREESIALLTTDMVLRLPATIAGSLTVTIGICAGDTAIMELADALAASDDRKIFLMLLALGTSDRDEGLTERIASKLPLGHPARLWLADSTSPIERTMLIDLGDASAVKEALTWTTPAQT